jgi:hypothetical protein
MAAMTAIAATMRIIQIAPLLSERPTVVRDVVVRVPVAGS